MLRFAPLCAAIVTGTFLSGTGHAALVASYSMEQASGSQLDNSGFGTALNFAPGGVGQQFQSAGVPGGNYGTSIVLPASTLGFSAGLTGSSGEWQAASGANKLNILSNSFTVMAWVNPADLTGVNRILSQTFASGTTTSWGFGLSGSEILFTKAGIADFTSSGAALTSAAWQHIAVTVSPTTGVSFYRNGDLVSSNTSANGIANLNTAGRTDSFRLFNGAGGQNLTGNLDEVRVYDTVLTIGEIRAAAVTAVPEPAAAGLVLLGALGCLRRRRR